jgi:putative RNA 2'-phosphotransferase
MSDRNVRISKFLSLVLRHNPKKIGIALDDGGWVTVSELLDACNSHGFALSLEELTTVVATNDKRRFALSEDGLRIRASQGHSVDVDLGYRPVAPPEFLYHGTAEDFLPSIRKGGLVKRKRHHVHLSKDPETATRVGARRGRPVVLTIKSGQMHSEGHAFYLSDNGVWLTEHVPASYLVIPDAGSSGALVGAWRLVSFEELQPGGGVVHPYGERPAGLLVYEATGRMAVQVMRRDRKALSSNELESVPPEELKQAVEGFTAFFGTYEIDEQERVIIHRVEGHLLPNSVGKDLRRRFELSGDRLILMPAATRRVTWERIG